MAKTASQNNLRALALAPMAGFRSKVISVPEWENAKVKLREPSGQAWLEWQQIINPNPEGEPEKLTAAERALRNKNADVVLFIDVLLNENDTPVFKAEDKPLVENIYGPVHARLLKQALDLSTSQADAEAK
ncbi:phage tail assembly chaperone [Pantoea latae]|uniref:Phage tail protein n=1 Tax=Pantoea latae TaxID=1964541 RepID=A0A1V9DF71_9GAMM|nr:phage tail assembly chaperone [Pantoea latae]OQP32436.1 phage tail protein [Pantoea latae]